VYTVFVPVSLLHVNGVVTGYSDLQSSRPKIAFKEAMVSSQSFVSSM